MGTLSIVTCHSTAYYVILCILAFTLVKAEAIWNYADLLVIGLGVFDEVLASLQKQEPRGVSMGKWSHLEMGPLLNRNLGFQWDIKLNILPTDVLICFFFMKMCERFQSILLVNSRAWHIYTRAANATGSSWLSSSAGSDLGSSCLFWKRFPRCFCKYLFFDCSRFDPFCITKVAIFMSSHHLQGFQSQIKHWMLLQINLNPPPRLNTH